MFDFTITFQDSYSKARAGVLTTPHGNIRTPCFLPVGTKATVKGIHPELLEAMDVDIILANTYHLMLRPGEDLIHEMGGLHIWTTWNRPILTDSGGFQVFSLGEDSEKVEKSRSREVEKNLVKITEEGVRFQSYLSGEWRFVTPEEAMVIQSKLGADIMMAFDECASGGSSYEYARSAMERTHRWLDRCIVQWQAQGQKTAQGLPQALFGICQGVIYDDLRRESAHYIASKPELTGVAIGGLSVGESKEDMYRSLEVVLKELPLDKPRYLMGVGTPEDVRKAVKMGVDMFDCVLPTRLGRHGSFWYGDERLNIRNQKFAMDPLPLVEDCSCRTCRRFSRSYIRHLFLENEMLGMQLLTEHNITTLMNIARFYQNMGNSI